MTEITNIFSINSGTQLKTPSTTESDQIYQVLKTNIRNKFKNLLDNKAVFVKQSSSVDFFRLFTDRLPEDTKPHYNCICCKQFFHHANSWAFLDDNFQARNILDEVFTETFPMYKSEGAVTRNFSIIENAAIELAVENKGGWDHFFAFTKEELDEINTRPAVDTNWVNQMTFKLAGNAADPEIYARIIPVLEAALYKPETIGLLKPLMSILDTAKKNSVPLIPLLRALHREKKYQWLYAIESSNAGNVMKLLRKYSVSESDVQELIKNINSNTDPERYKRTEREASEQALKRDMDKLIDLGVERMLERKFATRDDLEVFWTPRMEVDVAIETATDLTATQVALNKLLAKKDTTSNKKADIFEALDGVQVRQNVSLEKFKEILKDAKTVILDGDKAHLVGFTKPIDDTDYSHVLINNIMCRSTVEVLPIPRIPEYDAHRVAQSFVLYEGHLFMELHEVKERIKGILKENGTCVFGFDIKSEFKTHARAWQDLSNKMEMPEPGETFFAGVGVQMGMKFLVSTTSGAKYQYTITSLT